MGKREQAVGGNKTLLACYLSHRGQLLHYAGRIIGDTSLAEDLVQEAWLRCHGARPDSPLNFLYRVIRNLALDRRRQAVREDRHFIRMDDGAIQAIAADIPGSEAEAASRQELARLMAALNDLPEITQQAIILYRFDGLKLREIAQILDLSTARVHGLIVQGMERCRQIPDSTE